MQASAVGNQPAPVKKSSMGELAACPRCGVWVLNNGLMEHMMSKHECAALFRDVAPRGETASATLGLLGRIARTEGASGLYAGLVPTLVMAVPNTALYFTVYDELRNQLRGIVDGAVAPAAAGASARLVAATAVAPFELARTQLQALSPSLRGSYAAEIGALVRADGLASLWRGLSPTLWRDVPFSAVYWSSFDQVGLAFDRCVRPSDRRSRRLARAFISGLCAGAFAALLTTPFDVVKTRRMVDRYVVDSRAPNAARSTFDIVASIARQEGLPALFSGAFPRLLKVAPACAIMIGTYEYAKALFVADAT
ncbi:hypothetical protein CTAYLR_006546 [Chrysophaeum taylorii]|uniref:Mitochondrial carrier protein n=1 Tax=Chrysophaeum taylorii TaxID=2483200 RepID=A0AAD7XQ54_9STRA|nr:hypothetical protein CTAYLR_006546 [Chrysophaeum taylorii]